MKNRVVAAGLTVAAVLVPAAAWAQDGPMISYPYPRFARSGDSVTRVEDALANGDKYRDLCYQSALGVEANPLAAIGAALGENQDPMAARAYATEAKGWYRRAEDLEPQNAYAQLALGYVAMVIGRMEGGRDRRRALAEARAAFQLALERRPGYADAHRYLGELEALEENWAAAEKEFRLLLESNIEDSHIHTWLGYVLARQDRIAQAEEHWRKARDLGRPATCATYAADRLE